MVYFLIDCFAITKEQNELQQEGHIMTESGSNRRKFKYVLCKTAEFFLLLLVFSLLVFLMARLCPGDPLRSWYGDGIDRLSAEEKASARSSLGLDQPLLLQYVQWLRHLLTGNTGISFKYKQSAGAVIQKFWWNTFIFGLLSYALTFFLSFCLGKKCAAKEGSLTDRFLRRAGVVTGNIPSFFLSLLFILLFSVKLGILPAGGAYDRGDSASVVNRLIHLVLPVSVMVLGHLGYYSSMVRNLLVEETRKDYVLLMKAEGLPREKILSKYCMKNILPPMLAVMTAAVPHLLGGTYVVEMVFSYPGLGTLGLESALYHDYNMLMAVTLLTGAAVILFSFAAREISIRIDPAMNDFPPEISDNAPQEPGKENNEDE